MAEREQGCSKLKVIMTKVMSRRECLTLLLGIGEVITGYAGYRTDSLTPEVARAVTMSGAMTSGWVLIVGRALGIRSSLSSLISGHISGATTLLFEPPQKFNKR